MLDSTINVTSKGNEFHIQTDNTKITNLLVNTPAISRHLSSRKLRLMPICSSIRSKRRIR